MKVGGFKQTINLENLSRVTYLIRLNYSNGNVANEKFIKY